MESNLKEEIAILSEMNHDHIMCLHNVYVTMNEYHLVTEFLEGGELFDRIVAKDTYTESEARDVCKILFNALGYMAEKRVAHRDLKPENLLLQYKTSDSEIKIADFGFAKVAESEQCLKTICGTPGYGERCLYSAHQLYIRSHAHFNPIKFEPTLNSCTRSGVQEALWNTV